MSTRVRDRKQSKIEFLDNMSNLVAHTWKYVHKFPKSTRFIFQTKMCDYVNNAYMHLLSANSIFVKTAEDKIQRRKHINDAVGLIYSFEALLSIAQLSYSQYITDYGWLKWGEYIEKEITLLKGLLKKEEQNNLIRFYIE